MQNIFFILTFILSTSSFGQEEGSFFITPSQFKRGIHEQIKGHGATDQELDEKRAFIVEAILEEKQHLTLSESTPRERKYVKVSDYIAGGLGLSAPVHVLYKAEELKHLPDSMEGLNIVLVTSDASVLNAERMQKIITLAKAKKIQISALWTGADHQIGRENALKLAMVAGQTGGVFFDMNLIDQDIKVSLSKEKGKGA